MKDYLRKDSLNDLADRIRPWCESEQIFTMVDIRRAFPTVCSTNLNKALCILKERGAIIKKDYRRYQSLW